MQAAAEMHRPMPRTYHGAPWRQCLYWRRICSRQLCMSIAKHISEPDALPAEDTHTLLRMVEHLGARCSRKLQIATLSSGAGRYLLATEHIEAGEELLSVPLSAAISSDGMGSSYCEALAWSACMAMQLLEEVATTRRPEGSAYSDWIALLPSRVALPMLQFSEDELAACQDQDTLREALSMKETLHQAYEVVEPELTEMGFGRDDVDWALSIFHSRSFVVGRPATHLTVPGIDMANMSWDPSAIIRIEHNPDACQGREAVEEVCATTSSASPSRVEMIAGESGIRAGQEVTISYGDWPDDVFFLFFGFLPESNAHNSVVIFQCLRDMVQYHHELWSPQGAANVDTSTALLEAALGEGEWQRMVVTAEGFGGQAVTAAWKLLSQHQASTSQAQRQQIGQFLGQRCAQILRQYPTTLEQDLLLLRTGGLSENMELSVRYRMRKKQLLESVIRQTI